MIILTDSIQIDNPPEIVFDWFMNLDKNFTKWHQNHTKFTKLTGGMNVGDKISFEEKISGKWFKFNLNITKIEKDNNGWIIEAQTPPFAKLLFEARKIDDGCVFTHTETFGIIKSKNPFVQKIIISCLRFILNPFYRFDLIQKDIIEDNINLKRILENEYKQT